MRNFSPSIIGRTCTFDAKKKDFLAIALKLSRYSKRNKKKFQNWDFLLGVPAHLVENSV